MNLKTDFHIFLDIDGVLALTDQFSGNPKKWNPELNVYGFDAKAVRVFNDVCNITNPVIILSSDWKDHYTLEQINEHFEFNGINHRLTDKTQTLWGKMFYSLEELEQCRAAEILLYTKEHEILNYVVIDDLDLKPWLPPNTFVHTPRSREGIKQSGIKQKIINIYNSIQK